MFSAATTSHPPGFCLKFDMWAHQRGAGFRVKFDMRARALSARRAHKRSYQVIFDRAQ